MKNINILPTEKPSKLSFDFDIKQYYLQEESSFFEHQDLIENRNLYITNSEEIKEGDWMIRGNEQPIKVTKDFFWDFGVRYKIILTTDQDLIKDGVQAIDDVFLEWFVKNPNCKEVEVKSEILYEHIDTYRPYPSDCKNLTKTKVYYYLKQIYI